MHPSNLDFQKETRNLKNSIRMWGILDQDLDMPIMPLLTPASSELHLGKFDKHKRHDLLVPTTSNIVWLMVGCMNQYEF